MRKGLEAFGLSLEIVGLLVLLAATVWEAENTSWWDSNTPELQYLIQEQANLAMLGALSDLAKTTYVSDLKVKTAIGERASQEAREATYKLIDMRIERNKLLDGQPKDFARTRLNLLVCGAIAILLGKLLFLGAYWTRERKTISGA
ncbi:hypothetical protein N5K35_26010 [Pseudomonas sp. GD03651]|uniref:hypothetical protein n=1 Tax=Pseudomonas sp. GD03651 TaxID=2975361 RepID=UPI00244C9324|nr:hypothetical protein [Pseudomonas sp. GD03651]MDH2187146.1 hypothetical protein [Pseudomonas sp. GD03651]